MPFGNLVEVKLSKKFSVCISIVISSVIISGYLLKVIDYLLILVEGQ